MDVRTVRQGSGEPYVLIHGIGSHAEVWAPVMDALAARFSVVAVDLPGFGRSRAQVPQPTIERQADAFAGWLRDEGLEGCHVGGNSMGAAMSLELARRGVVRSAVALAPAGFWTPQERRWCQDSLARAKKQIRLLRPLLPAIAGTALGRTAFGWQVFGRPWAVPRQQMLATADALLAAEAFDEALALFDDYTFHDAEQLDAVPVTVVWGSRDRLLLSRQAARARRVLPKARHEWLVGAGHLPMWDAPEAVAALLVAGAAA
jgi:pimeloyl-ACP methyl ester carboxylesterase